MLDMESRYRLISEYPILIAPNVRATPQTDTLMPNTGIACSNNVDSEHTESRLVPSKDEEYNLSRRR